MSEDKKKKKKKISSNFISTSGPVPPRGLSKDHDEDDDEDDEKKLASAATTTSPSSASSSVKSSKYPRTKGRSIFAQRMAEKAAMRKNFEDERGGSGKNINFKKVDENGKKTQSEKTVELNSLLRLQGVIQDCEPVSSEDILKMREEFLRNMNAETRQRLLSRLSKDKETEDPAKIRSDDEPGMSSESLHPEEHHQRRSYSSELDHVVIETTHHHVAPHELPVNPEAVKTFPHMDHVEIDKLKWTLEQDKVDPEEKSRPADIHARFDMNGNVIDARSASERTWLQGLHHHGQEMDKPGYTFEELLMYARSSVVSQRAFALSAIAAIFRNAHEGIYDSVLSMNPLHLLMNVDVVCALRKALDFEDKVTLDAALACLSAVIFPTSEEECYDVAYLFPDAKPFLWHKVPNVDHNLTQDPTTRDHQILTSDLLLFLIGRSHLLDRLEYLLVDRVDRLSEAGDISIRQILIRIARHSPAQVLSWEGLMGHLCKSLTCDWAALCAVPARVPSATSSDLANCNPVAVKAWLTVKLFRVLVESSGSNARIVHSKYDLMTYVITYLASHSQYTAECCCHAKLLILESFRFWASSLEVGCGIEEFSTMFPTLAMNLRYFCEPEALKAIVSFDGYYLAQVFNFLHGVLLCADRSSEGVRSRESGWELVKDLEYFVVTITMQVLQILATTREDWTLVLAGRGLAFLTTALKWGKLTSRKASIAEHLKQIDLTHVAHSLQKHSVILNMSKIKSRYPRNFVSSSAVLTSSSVNPIVGKQSPFQFYKCWITFLEEMDCVRLLFIPEVLKYVELLTQAYPLEFFETFYIRFEQLLIFKMLKCMDPQDRPLSVPVQLVYTLSRADVCLFKGLLELIAAKMTTDDDSVTEEQRADVVRLYLNCFFPPLDPASIDVGDGVDGFGSEDLRKPMLFVPEATSLVGAGRQWMLEPLGKLAARYGVEDRRELKKYLPVVLHETKACLAFILYLLRNSSLFTAPDDMIQCYMYVTRIFRMGEQVFLEAGVEAFLRLILKELVALVEKIDVGKNPEPFTNFKSGSSTEGSFKDFYRDLLKEFESLSYCSDVFSAYLILPLIPSESREIKLLFWSMQGLQFVRIALNNDLIPQNYLIQEVETDRALLQLYTLLLVKTNTINRVNNELLFHILDYHVTRGLPVEDMQKVMKLAW